MARSLIQKAIEVYPQAHFGRERFQVYAMDWMLDAGVPPSMMEEEQSLGKYIVDKSLNENDENRESPTDERRKAAIDGISGIIVLGAGWESVDMFDALAEAFRWHAVRRSPIANLANLRVGELLRAGKRSGLPGRPLLYFGTVPPAAHADWQYWTTDSNYARLRKEAEQWQAKRTAYMMVRLRAGRHPDTDPTFWAEYKETPAPPIYNAPWPVKAWWWAGNNEFPLMFVFATFVPIALFIRSRWIARKTGRPSGFSWGDLVLFIIIVWFICLILFPTFAKARG
jgi:hypothetical protein